MSRAIYIFICLILTLLIGFFLIWPKYQEWQNLQVKIEGKETEYQYLQEHFRKLDQLSQKLKEYENQLAKIDFALPTDASLAALSLIQFLQEASSQNGLVFKKFGSYSITGLKSSTKTPGAPTTIPEVPSDIKQIRVDFAVSGSYSALKNFIQTLEQNAKFIEVENISFSSGEEETFGFNLKIKTYSY